MLKAGGGSNNTGIGTDDSGIFAKNCYDCRYLHGNEGGALGGGNIPGLTTQEQSEAVAEGSGEALMAATAIAPIPSLGKIKAVEKAVELIGKARLPGVAKSAGKEIGILRDAAKGKGNFGLGSGTRAEADKLGKAWVGDGARVASDGKTLVSKDGLKVYRSPSAKPNSPHATTGVQANFERKIEVGGRPISNGHLDILD